jgi:hypothetical protein
MKIPRHLEAQPLQAVVEQIEIGAGGYPKFKAVP